MSPIATAVSGEAGIERFAPLSDHLIAVEPDASLIETWNAVDGAPRIGGSDGANDGARAIGQIPICWDPDEDTAKKRAHDQFRWFGGGWAVNADLPTPAGFAGATQFVTPDDVAESIPCGPDLDAVVEAVSAYWKAGFTDIAIVQSATRARTSSSPRQPGRCWTDSAKPPLTTGSGAAVTFCTRRSEGGQRPSGGAKNVTLQRAGQPSSARPCDQCGCQASSSAVREVTASGRLAVARAARLTFSNTSRSELRAAIQTSWSTSAFSL